MAGPKNRTTIVAIALFAIAAIAFVYWRETRSEMEADNHDDDTGAARVGKVEPPAAPPRSGAIDPGASAPARVYIDDDPAGELRLEGQVIDGEDRGVANATVVLSANPPRTATTEANGTFVFTGLVARPYTLAARAPGAGVAGPVTAKLTDHTEPVILKLRAGVKLAVSVTTSDGKPVDGATVELRGIDDQREVTKGGVATFAQCVPGSYQLAGWSDGMAKSFAWIQLTAGEDTAKLVLRAGARVAGRVVDERGAGVSGARVAYAGASDWSQSGNDRRDGVTSGADGRFEFAALPSGTFRFTAAHAEHAPGTSPLVTLDGKTARDNVVISLADGVVVRGRVIDTQKQPVAGARVRIGATGNRRAMIADAPRQAYSDAKGNFEIKGLPKKPLAAIAMHETGASNAVELDGTKGDQTDVTLTIDVTGTIGGTVVDTQGNPLEGIQVSAGPSFGDNRTDVDFAQWRLRGFPEELTDSAGHFTLTGLAPGSYQLSAAPAHAAGRRGPFGGGRGGDITAKTGDKDVKIVLPPAGKVKGKVAFADGTAPAAFTIGVGFAQQSGNADGTFEIDDLAPHQYEVNVRGASFQATAVDALVEPGKTTDVGTITIVQGRTVSGTVVADGVPVPNAAVSIGRIVFGNGTSSNASFGPMGAGAKHDTTDANGRFTLSGFGEGDLTIVAEHDTIGRSRALRLPTAMPGQTELTLTLEKYGALGGVLRQAGKPAEGVFVTCQSTTTPGSIYSVASGPDGAYRFDRLAPDTYKVSATLGMPMVGMHFYSKQVDVPPGGNVTVDLAVEPGSVALDVTVVPKTGHLGVANAWLVSGTLTATTASELALRVAAAGPGASQWVIIRNGEPARFADVAAGAYSACVVPFPEAVRGMQAMGYGERHGDSLMAYCKSIAVAASPASQAVSVPVELPAFIPDNQPPPGGGSGSAGSASHKSAPGS